MVGLEYCAGIDRWVWRVGADVRYKTRLCRGFTTGTCTHGDKCMFAHGEWEIQR